MCGISVERSCRNRRSEKRFLSPKADEGHSATQADNEGWGKLRNGELAAQIACKEVEMRETSGEECWERIK